MRHAWRRSRVYWPDGNRLRRRWDRIETVLVLGLVALFAVAAPVIAVLAGRMADSGVRQQARAERGWHQVTAVVRPHSPHMVETSVSGWAVMSARAQWQANGRAHTGWVPVDPAGGSAGTVRVWVNQAGQLTPPPSAGADQNLEVGLAAAAGVLCVAVVVTLSGVTCRLMLNRRRLADWERAWRATGPEWSRQR